MKGRPMRLKIRHNMEMAHRLSQDTGKCLQIHGHGMQVELALENLDINEAGMCVTHHGDVLEFGAMKRKFREYIDSTYDHRLVLNQEDPWAQPIVFYSSINWTEGGIDVLADEHHNGDQMFLPGLSLVPGDPTVENLARWIGLWAATEFRSDVLCSIEETKTNGACARIVWAGTHAKVAH